MHTIQIRAGRLLCGVLSTFRTKKNRLRLGGNCRQLCVCRLRLLLCMRTKTLCTQYGPRLQKLLQIEHMRLMQSALCLSSKDSSVHAYEMIGWDGSCIQCGSRLQICRIAVPLLKFSYLVVVGPANPFTHPHITRTALICCMYLLHLSITRISCILFIAFVYCTCLLFRTNLPCEKCCCGCQIRVYVAVQNGVSQNDLAASQHIAEMGATGS
jgi:hypothetical protein